MKKILFFAFLSMSAIGFSQSYEYVPWGGSVDNPGATPYTIPDTNADAASKLSSTTAGHKFTKFDRSKEGSTPQEDDGKTYGRNAFSVVNPSEVNGIDERGWATGALTILPSPGYYSHIRSTASSGARSPGAWLKYTVDFTQAGKFNPILKVRDNGTSRNQTYEIKVYSVDDISNNIYTVSGSTVTTNFSGSAGVNTTSGDGTAKVVAIMTSQSGNLWYQIQTPVIIPAAGRYVVEISNTQMQGIGGFAAFTFWKQAAIVEPEVFLSSPKIGEVFEAGSPILLSAKAKAGDGTLSKVEFFDGTTSLGNGVAVGGGVYELTINAAGKIYNFNAVVTETGGVAPDTGKSVGDLKVIGIVVPSVTAYPGTPWNGTPWSFSSNNTANFVIGNAIGRSASDFYNGIPVWAYDIGLVHPQLATSVTSLNYVAGAAAQNTGSVGTDIRGAKALEQSKTLTASDDFSRDATIPGASRFLGTTDYRAATGGTWARYSCTFAPGQYKLLVRASNDGCNGNYSVYVRFLNPDGTTIAKTVSYNGGQPSNASCTEALNVVALDINASPYNTLTPSTVKTYWVMVDKPIDLTGNVIVEVSDPEPASGVGSPGNGPLGEFTFEYVGALSSAKFLEENLKVFANGRILNVNYNSLNQAKVSVFDLNGKQIVSKPIDNGSLVTELPTAGVYIVNVESNGTSKVTKVLVK
jgi:hypothetical protein